MPPITLTFASGPYDRMQALRSGALRPEGIDLRYLTLQPAEIFWRMLQHHEFDVSELSMSNYLSSLCLPDPPFIALPVFPSRVFRHGYIFVNPDKGITKPADLKGRRTGVPEYTQTAAVYARGLLQHEYGVKPSDLHWVQGRVDRLNVKLPANIRLERGPPGVELGDLLERGEIDALVTGNNPLSFRRGSPKVVRLLPNYRELERNYYLRTGIYPIMHTVVMRRDVYRRAPWIAKSLYEAFCTSKEMSQEAQRETGVPKLSFAWLGAAIEEETSVFGRDWYPYGIAPNIKSIEAIIQFTWEQGLTSRRLAVEELFAPGTLAL